MGVMYHLPHVNGGTPVAVNCSYCGASLEDERERAAASSPSGTKFFCKAPEENPFDSCYLAWRRRHH